MAKTEPDWTAIEVPYRAGIISVRQIAKSFGVALATLQRQAEKRGWTRELAPRVRQATRDRLAESDPHQSNVAHDSQSDPLSDPPESGGMSERTGDERRAGSPVGSPSYARAEIPVEDIIDAASRLQADVVRDHRKDLARTHRLCNKLVAELEAHTDAIDVIKAEIAAVTAGDKTDKRKRVLDRAVSHSTRAGSMRALAGAQKELVALERQAFGLDDGDGDKRDDFIPIEERLKAYAREKAMAEAGDKVAVLPTLSSS